MCYALLVHFIFQRKQISAKVPLGAHFYFRCETFLYSNGNKPVLFRNNSANLLALVYPTLCATWPIDKSVFAKRVSAWLIRRCCMYSVIVHPWYSLKAVWSFLALMQDIRTICSKGRAWIQWSLRYSVRCYNCWTSWTDSVFRTCLLRGCKRLHITISEIASAPIPS